MIISVKKLWNGMIPLRGKYANLAIKNKEDLKVKVGSKTYVLTPEELEKPHMSRPVKDYYSEAMHQLLYYKVKPKTETNNQQTLL